MFYKPLTKENVTKIIDLQIAKLNDRLADQQIRCELTPAAKAAIVDAAYDPQYGARPLRRYVQAERYSIHSKIQTQIVKAQLGNNAGIIGAALLYQVK